VDADDPFAGMNDARVLALATQHWRTEASLPPNSLGRIIAAQQYDRCKAELDRRAMAYGLARLAELHGGDPSQPVRHVHGEDS
jgi:hypothetical protein